MSWEVGFVIWPGPRVALVNREKRLTLKLSRDAAKAMARSHGGLYQQAHEKLELAVRRAA